ncbi:MAG: dTMP kinase [Acidimicrobiia bacterium]
MTERRGRFIVLEGGEGSGKSTQAKRLVSRIVAAGRDATLTHEPGHTRVGEEIRLLLLHEDWTLDPRTELLLMLADRAQHVAEVIRPALDAGTVVVSDRYAPSSLAYQGVGRELGVDAVDRVSALAAGGLEPDLVVVLDLPDDVASSRVAAEADRMERAGEAFHAAVRGAYRTLAAERGWVVVPAHGSREEVAERVWAVVEPVL